MTTETPAKKNRVSLKAVALLILVFLLGAVCGIGTTTMTITKRLQSAFRENLRDSTRSHGPADRVLDRIEAKLGKELELTGEEQAAVAAEFDTTRQQIRDVRTGAARDIRRIAIDSVLRITGTLPDEKRQTFREMARKRLEPWGMETR